jgi:hypothetical protein
MLLFKRSGDLSRHDQGQWLKPPLRLLKYAGYLLDACGS